LRTGGATTNGAPAFGRDAGLLECRENWLTALAACGLW
jgi:hypothetical protein